MGALDAIVRSGCALYAGISSYNSERTREAARILADLGTPRLIHQPSYNLIDRWVDRDGLKATLQELGIGSIAFHPLAQGMLTAKYLDGIPEGSRATRASRCAATSSIRTSLKETRCAPSHSPPPCCWSPARPRRRRG